MINIKNSTLLAFTKLRTHRIRTIFAVGVASLLFSILIAALTLFQGTFKSLTDFHSEGLNDRFIITAQPNHNAAHDIVTNDSLIKESDQLYRELVNNKRQVAKELDLPYDPSSEPRPYTVIDFGTRQETRLDPNNSIAKTVMFNFIKHNPTPSLKDLQDAASTYNPIGIYVSESKVPRDGSIEEMIGGEENFSPPSFNTPDEQPTQEPVITPTLNFLPPQIAEPFLLPSPSWKPSTQRVPIILPLGSVATLLKLPALDSSASSNDRLDRIQTIYKRSGNLVFTACYRNDVSKSLIQQAASSKLTKTAALLYNLPDSHTCGRAKVASDTRTPAQKILDEKTNEFNKKFGVNTTPKQEKIDFQIVGISPDQATDGFVDSTSSLVHSILQGTSIPEAIPEAMYNQLPNRQRLDSILAPLTIPQLGVDNDLTYSVEFDSADNARRFLNERSCTQQADGYCHPLTNKFSLRPLGGNTLALDDLKNKFFSVFNLVALATIGFAIIIMSTSIGKVIGDSRRETAIFRAIGFSRVDIGIVYTIYTLILSLFILTVSLLVGLSLAYVVDDMFGRKLTIEALLAFGGVTSQREFHFFAIDYIKLFWLVCIILSSGFISMLLPLLHNLSRNPIQDMRDE